MSIRLRLTLLYSVILAMTLVLFSATLYAIQSQSTLNVHKRDLASTADRMARGLAMARVWQGFPERGPGAPVGDPEQPADQEFRLRDTVRYLYADGTVAEFPINDQEMTLPLDSAGLQALQQGQAWSEIARVEGVRWSRTTGTIGACYRERSVPETGARQTLHPQTRRVALRW